MQNILLLEDNQALSDIICYSLDTPYIKIHQTKNLDGAYQLLTKVKFDLAIVDRIVEDGDGLELVEYLSQELKELKILIISHKNKVAQRLEGLRLGAIDYLAKPFHVEELRLKTKHLLRLNNFIRSNRLQVGDLVLHQESGLITVNDYHNQLRKREAELLACLMRRKNYVVTRDQIISAVWGLIDNPPLYSTLDVYIRRIRIKLGPASQLLSTVRGFGYKISEPTSNKNKLKTLS